MSIFEKVKTELIVRKITDGDKVTFDIRLPEEVKVYKTLAFLKDLQEKIKLFPVSNKTGMEIILNFFQSLISDWLAFFYLKKLHFCEIECGTFCITGK